MSIGSLFFSAQGRIGRGAYAAGIGGLLGLSLVAGAAVGVLAGADSPVSHIVVAVMPLALAYPLICVNSKRLHDFGRSGWWQILINVGVTLLTKVVLASALQGDSADLVNFAIYLVFYGGLALVPGDVGRNTFGDPAGRRPLAQAVQVFD